MTRSFAPGLAAHACTTVRKLRELPIQGKVLCKVGDEVTAEQVVAEAELQGEMRIVRASDELGLAPTELPRALKVKEGDSVSKDDMLAEISGLWGLFRQSVSSPLSGVIEFISTTTGHIGVRAPATKLELSAYISGRVVEVQEGRSALIESNGAYVQGIFGVGGERLGKLKILPIGQNETFEARHVPADAAGQILVGGKNVSYVAIKAAIKAHAVGIVTSSVDDGALRELLGYDIGVAITGDEQIPITLIITEGFGDLPLSNRVIDILKLHDGKVCSINGATQVRAGAIRPEIIIPLASPPAEISSHDEGDGSLAVGRRIRCVRVPYFGELGTITELPTDPERIETGAWTRVLRATLDRGESVTVPRANVERI